MRKLVAPAIVLASGLIGMAPSAMALQAYVTSIDKNGDGSATYHFEVQTDPGETLVANKDFVTVYNFAGLVAGSAKAPSGWGASSEEFGKTPTADGYPLVNPVDIPRLSNITWTAHKTVPGGAKLEGFSATTSISATTVGQYSAQVTREAAGKSSMQAVIGTIQTPDYIAR